MSGTLYKMQPEPSADASSLQVFLGLLQDIARTAGFVFAFVGGFLFFLSVCHLLGRQTEAAKIAEVLRWSGVLLTISWLLLRFAAGLFPFGRRVFR